MFNFIKQILNKFKKKKKKISILGVKKVEYDFCDWVKKAYENKKIDSFLLENLKILFIKSDFGLKTTFFLIKKIENIISKEQCQETSYLLPIIREGLINVLQEDDIKYQSLSKKDTKSQIYLLVGVNGTGKTTTIGKLAQKFKNENKKVLLVAGDTFRTGALEQLKMWQEKTQNEIFFKEQKNKSVSSLFFDALTYAKKNNFDVILCDTSGRLENKTNLMSELKKIKKIIEKIMSDAYLQTFLVLDAMTGQNALKQVDLFHKLIVLNGIILTKYDGISKGGIILAIKYLYNLSVKYVGVGENVNDLITFDINEYVNNYFPLSF
ncbi:signal recognition particle-docking protein FtsY [Candidatus Phytoplasma pini]|uniref:Signal recognition particle-docking protein n=1 Tax=Candidatus Phytoplasma pini TaxID=267362 RepID=A0A559KJB4_9MOLU|nr:signal recognition particle-docking protein FtsY [Candidatus Phytoplasma pini]TVY12224.1 Signal recognition particle-docking protein [Candidatus Phytoplasma pini]